MSSCEVLVSNGLLQLMLRMWLLMISNVHMLRYPVVVLVLLHSLNFEVAFWPELEVKPVKTPLFLWFCEAFHVNAASLLVWEAHHHQSYTTP